jgi:hypothetical protein
MSCELGANNVLPINVYRLPITVYRKTAVSYELRALS